MATVTYAAALPDYKWIPDYFGPNDSSLITARTATKITWTNPDGSKVELAGTGLAYDGGEPISGTITTIRVRDSGGTLLYTITGLKQDAQNLYFVAFGYERDDGRRENGDGFNFLSTVLNESDVFNGSNESEEIGGARGGGNDIINAGGGNDYIHGGAGNTTIDGGADWDTVTYDESFYDFAAFRGVAANLNTGAVTDCWGGKDTLSSIEEVIGSKFADRLTGNDLDNALSGLRGNDILIGGDGNGYDEVLYHRDARFGGSRGINADLVAGTIRDGFGNTDTVSGFERVIGTGFNDKFKGDGGNNHFQGQAGKDSYDGGLGEDRVIFRFWENQSQGATVNLALATNQVLNDGFGNVEKLVSIEQLEGTDLADNFTGNAANNFFMGRDGNDILNGGGGSDELQGGRGSDQMTGGAGGDVFSYWGDNGTAAFGDTITDFKTGTDRIAFHVPDFNGMDATVRFNVGASAGGAGSWFFFNANTKGLFWDADGTGAGAAVRVATLTGVTTMVATDIELWT
ncbi:hypothetical protein [Aestuariivirga sp.]|uniref:calcium-binding protein n=1 Tax=Aestuariivirga sp. TaxID=2650926 RepID=UPI0035939F7F